MTLPTILRSPLTATAGVLIGLSLLAIPLHQLTSTPSATAAPSPTPAETTNTPAWITLKLLEPAQSASLSTPDGDILWSTQDISAGDYEARIDLPIDDGKLEMILEVKLQAEGKESAAFLTIAPDAMEQQSRHTIGSDQLLELFTFTWPHF